MKVIVFVLGASIFLSVGVIVGAWYVLERSSTIEQFTAYTASSTPGENNKTPITVATTTENGRVSASVPFLEKPITISTLQLTESQRKVLDVLGVEEQTFVITPGMVLCAVQALGAVRVTEIQKGASPTLTEGLTLLTCTKK